MSLVLPKPVAAYFAAENRDDTEALVQCFAEHAVVRDEGRTIEGLAAIKQWHVEAKKNTTTQFSRSMPSSGMARPW